MKSYTKIWSLGTSHIENIFNGVVEITEKLDGSQFGFGKFDGELVIRSKNKIMLVDAPEKMFNKAAATARRIHEGFCLNDGDAFYAEYISSNKHNVLTYNEVPQGNLALYAWYINSEARWATYEELSDIALLFGIGVVPLLFRGVCTVDDAIKYSGEQSALGGCIAEGIVVKRFEPYWLGGQLQPLMAGKFVTSAFKEKHEKDWSKENTGKGKYEMLKDELKTEARWTKAVYRLRDSGDLVFQPKDIGMLVKEIQNDVEEEEKEYIMSRLYEIFGQEILRHSINGFPDWYKEQLARGTFYAE